jgi:dipeptidyl-peptidase 4
MRPLLTLALVCSAALLAQQPSKVLTAADYARAEKFMSYNTAPLVFGNGVRANWIGGTDGFWYRVARENGAEFILVDPAKGTRAPAFDHPRLAAALSTAANEKYEAARLPFQNITLAADGSEVSFQAAGKSWKCTLADYRCVADAAAQTRGRGGRGGGGGGRGGAESNPAQSPDKKFTAFIRDWNLWLRDASGAETQLTTDGAKDFGYATDNAGWRKSDRAIVLWSPDSKKIATFQQDQRNVGEMYLVNTQVGHPKLEVWKYPLPGDEVVTTIQRVVIEIDSKKVTRLKMEPDQHRSTICDDIVCRGGEWADVQWSPDSTKLAFVSTSRDHKRERLREADAATGDVREVYEESVATQYESGDGQANWQVLYGTNEYIWYSEKTGWGHLYLGDWKTGRIEGPITSGDWVVRQRVRVDEKKREIWFLGAGREKGDPYFNYLYKIGYDGKGLQLLTSENASHEIAMSPSGAYFVDSYSKPDIPQVTVLRDAASGKLISTLEKADVSKLQAAGWKPPIPVTVKARDGTTDLYGLMFVPTNLDPSKKYPVVNHIYPGPQSGSVGSRSFTASRGDAQSLAELGFVVVEIDGTGNPTRSKAFHDAYYGNMGDNTLPDQIAAMKQLAERYPYIDIDNAGIYGHSGGGFATADAMFRYPDFFKVGIAESGNHDNRSYEDDWGERYQGLLKESGGKTNYDDQANQNIAKNLKGHLLLAHGTLDSNVPPYNTLLVVDALIKANKDFDLLLLPNQAHGYGGESNYMTRRRWDYFVRYLMGAEPPKDYRLQNPPEQNPTESAPD